MRVPKKRVLVASLLIVSVLALGLASAALAQLMPMLSIGTVYVDGELAGEGLLVEVFVGDVANGNGTTSAEGKVFIQSALAGGDVIAPVAAVSYTVDGVAATETPDVSASQEPRVVRLDVVSFDPWDYDSDQDDVISKTEALGAVNDYFDNAITKAEVLEVVVLYFNS